MDVSYAAPLLPFSFLPPARRAPHHIRWKIDFRLRKKVMIIEVRCKNDTYISYIWTNQAASVTHSLIYYFSCLLYLRKKEKWSSHNQPRSRRSFGLARTRIVISDKRNTGCLGQAKTWRPEKSCRPGRRTALSGNLIPILRKIRNDPKSMEKYCPKAAAA